jgi:integrase
MKTLNRLRPHDVPKLLRRDGSHNDGGSLYLVVRGGRGAWVFQFRDGSKLRSKGLGTLPDVTLAQARKKRADVLAGHRNEPTVPKSDGLAFGVLAEKYLTDHATDYGAAQLTRNRALLRLHAAPLSRRRVNRITVEEVAEVLRPLWNSTANSRGAKLRALIERILDAAELDRNPATWSRLQNHLSRKPAKTLSVASLPYRQLPAVYAELMSVGEGPGLMAVRVLRFLILTGVRLKEARGAQWSEIDFDEKLWTIPAERMKIKNEDFKVPLSDQALAVVREMQDGADRDTNDGFIFPGRWSHQCIGRNAIHLALARLQGDDDDEPRWVDDRGRKITVHGFRATMATWAQEQLAANDVRLFDQETIEGCLAHFVGGLKGTYQRSRHPETRRKLMAAWGAFVSTPQPDAPLVPDAPNRVETTRKKSKTVAPARIA